MTVSVCISYLYVLMIYLSALNIMAHDAVLAAWMRLKYPHIAIGALASSAPVLQFEDIVPPETYYDIVSNDFRVCFKLLVYLVCIM